MSPHLYAGAFVKLISSNMVDIPNILFGLIENQQYSPCVMFHPYYADIVAMILVPQLIRFIFFNAMTMKGQMKVIRMLQTLLEVSMANYIKDKLRKTLV